MSYLSAANADSIALAHLLADRRDLVQRLVEAYLGHHGRIWDNYLGRTPRMRELGED